MPLLLAIRPSTTSLYPSIEARTFDLTLFSSIVYPNSKILFNLTVITLAYTMLEIGVRSRVYRQSIY